MLIDTEKLSTITQQELGLLLLLYDKRFDKSRTVLEVKDVDIEKLFESLEKKRYIISTIYATNFNYKPPYKHVAYSILEKGKQALAENTAQEKPLKTVSVKEATERCDKLAEKLMEIYPAGTKPGTSLKWRGYSKNVSQRLVKLIMNGNEFTDEEAIQATKNYVASFNGVYTTMRVLPYFISKNVISGGEVDKTCDFMSYIEDLKSNPEQNNLSRNWEVELR